MKMTIGEWLQYGIDNGFCSDIHCTTCDQGVVVDQQERELLENKEEICLPYVRIWPQDTSGLH